MNVADEAEANPLWPLSQDCVSLVLGYFRVFPPGR